MSLTLVSWKMNCQWPFYWRVGDRKFVVDIYLIEMMYHHFCYWSMLRVWSVAACLTNWFMNSSPNSNSWFRIILVFFRNDSYFLYDWWRVFCRRILFISYIKTDHNLGAHFLAPSSVLYLLWIPFFLQSGDQEMKRGVYQDQRSWTEIVCMPFQLGQYLAWTS